MVDRARLHRVGWARPLLLLIALVAVAVSATAAPAADAPVEVTFVKVWAAPGYYAGTTGDGGTIEMWVSNSSVTGSMQHFDVTLRASLSGARSFTAMLEGTFNFSTAKTLLNGTVTEGWLTGARIHEEGQLAGLDPLTFTGTLRLMPASA